jgi:membrane protein implicated in regulation of membrane protease activity
VSRLLGTALNLSLLFAFVGAMTLWTGAFWLITQVFGKAEGTSHNRRHELIGLRAQVTVPIDGNKPGMIAYTVSGSRQSLRAISEEDEPIPSGAAVRIRRIEENTALVVRVDG